MRGLFAVAAAALATAASAQGRHSTCIWGEDFEAGIPAGWSTSQAERQTPGGQGLGEFVPAFTAGTAADANAGGFFPVPDLPVGNRFAMANDDGFPCNCDLSEALLETPSINLGGSTAIALDLRVFHTQALGGGDAFIDYSANGGPWTELAALPPAPGWQALTFNISSLAGVGNLRLRFRWSDNGNWASGFALDDLCIRAMLGHDLAVAGARLGDAASSPFASASNGLGYRLLPLEQSRPVAVSAELRNLGMATLYDVAVSVTATQGGVDHGPYTATIDSIASGQRATVVVHTDWAPDALGEVTYAVTALSPTGEDDLGDNMSAAVLRMTGPGWDHAYGAMALDAGAWQGTARSAQNFIAAVRMEIAQAGSQARGVSALIDPASAVGERVRAVLMDASFNVVDTSLRHVLTPVDLAAAALGEPLYLPFAAGPALAAGDYFAGLQRLSGTGQVGVAVSGNCPLGAAALLEGLSFDITWLEAVPMVRLHLSDYGVGMGANDDAPPGLDVFPQPMADAGWVRLGPWSGGTARLLLTDGQGRRVRHAGNLSPAGHAQLIPIDVTGLSPGLYLLRAEGPGFSVQQRVLVLR